VSVRVEHLGEGELARDAPVLECVKERGSAARERTAERAAAAASSVTFSTAAPASTASHSDGCCFGCCRRKVPALKLPATDDAVPNARGTLLHRSATPAPLFGGFCCALFDLAPDELDAPARRADEERARSGSLATASRYSGDWRRE